MGLPAFFCIDGDKMALGLSRSAAFAAPVSGRQSLALLSLPSSDAGQTAF